MTRALGLDHVQVAMPRNQEAEARAFYRDLLELRELPKPAELAQRGGVWFQCGALELHLGVEDDFRPAKKAHPAFVVDDLTQIAQRLAAAGFKLAEIEALGETRRAFTEDPFGNRVELLQLKPSISKTTLADHHQLHGLQPVLPVADVAKSATYFSEVLGFEVDFLVGDPPRHGRVKKGDGSYGHPIFIHLSKADPDAIRPGSELRIHVGHDLDGLFEAYRGRGVDIISVPVVQPWGLREFAIREPNGHVLRFCAEG